MAEKESFQMTLPALEIDEKLRKVDNIADETIKRLSNSGQIGYEEVTLVEVVPETTADFVPMEDIEGLPGAMFDFDPTPGATYDIKWDGVEYVCVATAEGIVGNGGIAGEEDTGEPFVFLTGGAIATTEGEHTFSVIEHQTTLYPMAKKWLPSTIFKESHKITFHETGLISTFDGPYDFLEFAENGVLDFFAICVPIANNGERGASYSTRFIATKLGFGGRVDEYCSMPLDQIIIGSVIKRAWVTIDVFQEKINGHWF